MDLLANAWVAPCSITRATADDTLPFRSFSLLVVWYGEVYFCGIFGRDDVAFRSLELVLFLLYVCFSSYFYLQVARELLSYISTSNHSIKHSMMAMVVGFVLGLGPFEQLSCSFFDFRSVLSGIFTGYSIICPLTVHAVDSVCSVSNEIYFLALRMFCPTNSGKPECELQVNILKKLCFGPQRTFWRVKRESVK